jgi:hypothetical protein
MYMKDFSRSLPAMLVASCALVVAASGTAGALAGKGSVDKDDLQKNVVTSKNVKNGSLKGADIKKDSLTGKQVKESSLGTVPSAATVETVKFFEANLTEGQSRTLVTEGTISAVAKCVANAANTDSSVLAATTQAGAFFAGDNTAGVLSPATLEGDRDFESNNDAAGGNAFVSNGYDDQFWIRAADGTTIFGTVATIVNADTSSCQFFGTYTSE